MRDAVQLYTLDKAAEMLAISKPSLYRLMREGEIDWRIVASKRRIRADDLARYIERDVNGESAYTRERLGKKHRRPKETNGEEAG